LGQSDEEQLANLTFNLPNDEDDVKFEPSEDSSTPTQWTARRSMKSLDVVRAVAVGPGGEGSIGEITVVSGGDDCIINVWRLDSGSLSSR